MSGPRSMLILTLLISALASLAIGKPQYDREEDDNSENIIRSAHDTDHPRRRAHNHPNRKGHDHSGQYYTASESADIDESVKMMKRRRKHQHKASSTSESESSEYPQSDPVERFNSNPSKDTADIDASVKMMKRRKKHQHKASSTSESESSEYPQSDPVDRFNSNPSKDFIRAEEGVGVDNLEQGGRVDYPRPRQRGRVQLSREPNLLWSSIEDLTSEMKVDLPLPDSIAEISPPDFNFDSDSERKNVLYPDFPVEFSPENRGKISSDSLEVLTDSLNMDDHVAVFVGKRLKREEAEEQKQVHSEEKANLDIRAEPKAEYFTQAKREASADENSQTFDLKAENSPGS